jgi:hypothetical protein
MLGGGRWKGLEQPPHSPDLSPCDCDQADIAWATICRQDNSNSSMALCGKYLRVR